MPRDFANETRAASEKRAEIPAREPLANGSSDAQRCEVLPGFLLDVLVQCSCRGRPS